MPLPQKSRLLSTIDLDELRRIGISGIILDLDNTVVSEDDRWLSPGAETWIARAKASGFKVYLLSNGKRRYRVRAWSQRLRVPAINPAHKPFPFAFYKAMRQMQLRPTQVIVIGDSRHTDMLGAWLVGCPSIQVVSLPHPPRWWERLFGKWVQIPCPRDLELWSVE